MKSTIKEFIIDPKTGKLALNPIYRKRINTLIRELQKHPDGFIAMETWADPRIAVAGLRAEAEANPCGTACCLAGKAGLMKVFQAQGFSWRFDDLATTHGGTLRSYVFDPSNAFTMNPSAFFGAALTSAVFTGHWACANLSTPAQAIIVLRAFLRDAETAKRQGFLWEPSTRTQSRIRAMSPERKNFPVSQRAAIRISQQA